MAVTWCWTVIGGGKKRVQIKMAAAKMARQSLVTQKSRLCKIVIDKNQTVPASFFFCAIVPDNVCREEEQY